jgi:hypothetical protein
MRASEVTPLRDVWAIAGKMELSDRGTGRGAALVANTQDDG